MASRKLRDVPGYEAAAEEVTRAMAPHPVRQLVRQAGAWVPPPSLKVVTPPLLYNLAIGIQRNAWCARLDREERAEREQEGAEVIDLRTRRERCDPSSINAFRESLTLRVGVPWLPPTMYPRRDGHPLEPSVDEFVRRDFGPVYIETEIEGGPIDVPGRGAP